MRAEEYLSEQGMSIDQIDILCRIKDNRSISTASFEKPERKILKTLYGYVTNETYANGEFWLLNDKGYEVVEKYNRLSEADYTAMAEREALVETHGYRLFGHPLGGSYGAPLELHEVTICSSPTGLRYLASHLIQVAAEMEATSQDAIDDGAHWHFQPESRPEIVVCGLSTDSKALPPIIYDEALENYKRP